jgi:AraC-like DNA-binding protein
MTNANTYTVDPGWRLLLNDLGIRPGNVLRRAGLPGDLFGREKSQLTTDEYFRLWQAIQDEMGDPLRPLRMAEMMTVEAFDPSIFAALCSSDLNTALGRISRYKRLICPQKLTVDVRKRGTTLGFEWLGTVEEPPPSLVTGEQIFFVQLARIATREKVVPLKLSATHPPEQMAEYNEYFGVPIRRGKRPEITFSPEDATRPFLTANEKMWDFFEPELKKRLSELDEKATTSERVHAALLELLPSGESSVTNVAKKLGAGPRTLQRRLKNEGKSFQGILDSTREELAKHYLKSSSYSGAEISFLLGFEDPNSFFRAFHSWTGTTPEQARMVLSAS